MLWLSNAYDLGEGVCIPLLKCNLGVILDPVLSLEAQVTVVTRGPYYKL